MPLTKCEDCGSAVSTLATNCPQCGRPMAAGLPHEHNVAPETLPPGATPPSPARSAQITSTTRASTPIIGIVIFLFVWFAWPWLSQFFTTTHQVTYRVIGSATSVRLTYMNEQGGTQQEEVSLPWAKTFAAKTGKFLYISATNGGKSGDITSRIEADGKIVKQSTSSGAYTFAEAHAPCCEPMSN